MKKRNQNAIKLINKIVPKYTRIKSASTVKLKERNSNIKKYLRPQSALYSSLPNRNLMNKSYSRGYSKGNNNKSCEESSNLNILNLMIKNNPFQYDYNKIKKRAKLIKPIFSINNNKFIKNLNNNTKNVLYRYNILYGNNPQNIIMTYSPKMRPCSKSVKEFTKTIKESEEDKQILNEKEISLLIKAKCKDIGIDFRETMFIKFKDFCKSKCKNRIADFSECYFGINSIKVINNLLLDKNRISRLNLTRNNLGDYGVELLVNSLINSISLVSLNITSNSISHRGGNIIFKSFIHQQSIIDLNISSIEGINRNRITSLGLKHIVVYLKKNIFIEILNLSGNSIKSEGFSLLCKGLKYNISLQNLDISNNDIHEKGIKKGIQFLNDSKIYTKLQILNLSNNPILNGGIIEITNNLRYFPNLKSINIAFCGIEFKGFNYLLRTVQYIKRIEYLNVSGNKLKDKEFSSIKPYFSSFNIRYLNMAKCSLCDINAYALGECLAANETLKTVNISDNEITDKGFKSFINLFKANISIENFDCSNNFITDISGKEFVNILKNNISLKYINLYDNQLHDEIGNLFLEMLDINKTLVHINLNYNRVQVKTIEELNKKLKINYDKQKTNFVPDLVKNIKDLEFQPEQFSILSKKILEKKNLQNYLYKKVQEDDKKFCSSLNIQNKKIEKELVHLQELIKNKKDMEKKILEINRGIDINNWERRKKEENIKEKIEKEENILKEINEENNKLLLDYNLNKDELMAVLDKTQKEFELSKDKIHFAKLYYDNKDKEYIQKFSYYQDLINPDLLVPIIKPIIRAKSKKNLYSSIGPSDFNDKNKEKKTKNYKKIEENKSNDKVNGKLRSNTKLILKKSTTKQYNIAASATTSFSAKNLYFKSDEKSLNTTFNRTFKFNKANKK